MVHFSGKARKMSHIALLRERSERRAIIDRIFFTSLFRSSCTIHFL
ncbi:MAG: hypothetical protein U5L45_15460 [Saprospiraceae bacterium]|nr:hypothetical protein [Saprospiraceae bacterium]